MPIENGSHPGQCSCIYPENIIEMSKIFSLALENVAISLKVYIRGPTLKKYRNYCF